MSKRTFGMVIGILAVAAGIYWFTRPEPTPSDRLEDALISAGGSLREAGEALSDGARETGEDLRLSATESAAELAEGISQSVESARQEADRLLTAWEDSGILTEDGFDHDNAVKAVEDSSLDGETKDKIITILMQIREAPELFDAKLAELLELLTQ